MEKQRWQESEKRREGERRSKKRKSKKKEDEGAGKGRTVAIHCVFPMICAFGGSKSRLAKAAGTTPSTVRYANYSTTTATTRITDYYYSHRYIYNYNYSYIYNYNYIKLH